MSIFFSKKKNIISFEEHSRWFNKNLHNIKIKFYIGFSKSRNNKIKKKIGIVRFYIKNKHAFVSINLNPVMRGKKLSNILLSEAIKKFLKFKKIDLVAAIKENNLPSIKCFLKNKFYFYKSTNEYRIYKRSLG